MQFLRYFPIIDKIKMGFALNIIPSLDEVFTYFEVINIVSSRGVKIPFSDIFLIP